MVIQDITPSSVDAPFIVGDQRQGKKRFVHAAIDDSTAPMNLSNYRRTCTRSWAAHRILSSIELHVERSASSVRGNACIGKKLSAVGRISSEPVVKEFQYGEAEHMQSGGVVFGTWGR